MRPEVVNRIISQHNPWTGSLSLPSLDYQSLIKGLGEGTEHGPAAAIEASSQVELYDPLLKEELPCGLAFHTAKPWSSEAGTLREQLDSVRDYLIPWLNLSLIHI